MRITCHVKPRSRKEEIVQIGPAEFEVRITQMPIDGKANEGLIRALGSHFKCAKSCITIVSGHSSKRKIIDIIA